MAKRAQNGVNKSQEIRDLLQKNPDIKATDAVKALGERSVKVTPGLFYFIKGKVQGRKSRRRQIRRKVSDVTGVPAKSDVLATIRKVKTLASEVGGLGKLKALVEALSQ